MIRLPDHVEPTLVRRFDHHDGAELAANPLAALDAERASRPYFYSDCYEGFWVFTRYEQIRDILQQPENFSSYPAGIPGTNAWPRRLIPEELDPPEHATYRRVLAPQFTLARARALEPRAREMARRLLEQFADQGRCEFIEQFARPFPTTLFMEIFGLPPDDSDLFLEWNYALNHGDRTDPQRRGAAGEKLISYLVNLAEDRRDDPRDDLLSILLRSHVDDRPLTSEEIVDICFVLFMAGLDTVTAAIGFAVVHLADNEQHRKALAREPSRIPRAIEELLRSHSFVNVARTATTDVDVAGCPVRAGDRLLLPTSSAGRDEVEFTNAAVVDFDRPPADSRHLAFGAGPHRCLGSHLARMELRVALEELLRVLPDFRTEPGFVKSYHLNNVAGLRTLSLVWDR